MLMKQPEVLSAESGRRRHDAGRLILILLTVLIFLVAMAMCVLIMIPYLPETVFSNFKSGGLYETDIEPHPWTFVVWGVIYVWQFIMNFYFLSLLCQPGTRAGYLYFDPPFLSVAFFLVYIVAQAIQVSELFAWDYQRADVTLPLLFLLGACLCACVFLSVRGIYRYGLDLFNSGNTLHIQLVRGIVQNGLATQLAWVVIETLLSFAQVLEAYAGAPRDTAGTIALGILAVEGFVYLILDWCVFEPYMRAIFMPYFVLVGSLVGILINNWDPWVVNTILTTVLLGLAGLALLIKIIYASERMNRAAEYYYRDANVIVNTDTLVKKPTPLPILPPPDVIQTGRGSADVSINEVRIEEKPAVDPWAGKERCLVPVIYPNADTYITPTSVPKCGCHGNPSSTMHVCDVSVTGDYHGAVTPSNGTLVNIRC